MRQHRKTIETHSRVRQSEHHLRAYRQLPGKRKNELDESVFCSDLQEGLYQFLSAGLVDVFRALYPSKAGAYMW